MSREVLATHNKIAAFVEFCGGTGLEEIAHALAIPLDTLKRWRNQEKWDVLAPKLPPIPRPGSAKEQERAREKIKANREKNLEIARQLQEDLLETVQKLRRGELKVTKIFANGMRIEVEPGLRDRNDLALYAKNIADMSYRALGDVADSPKNADGGAAMPMAGQIAIILPPLVAAPREERPEKAVDVDSEVLTIPNVALIEAAEDTQLYGPPLPSHDETST